MTARCASQTAIWCTRAHPGVNELMYARLQADRGGLLDYTAIPREHLVG